MLESRIFSTLVPLAFVGLVAILSLAGVAAGAPPAEPKTTSLADTVAQIAELQKQLAELKSEVKGRRQPRIVAAGTTTAHIEKRSRIELPDAVAKKLGDADYIVIATTRAPTSGLPVFAPFWEAAKNGFDLWLVDLTLPPNSRAEYWGTRNRTFVVDWIVVRK
jgi:hypothetical protein